MTVTIDLTDSSSTRSEQISSHHLIFHFLSFLSLSSLYSLCTLLYWSICVKREREKSKEFRSAAHCLRRLHFLSTRHHHGSFWSQREKEKRVIQSFVSWYSPSWIKSTIWTQEHSIRTTRISFTSYPVHPGFCRPERVRSSFLQVSWKCTHLRHRQPCFISGTSSSTPIQHRHHGLGMHVRSALIANKETGSCSAQM